jgi:hypothetical protein
MLLICLLITAKRMLQNTGFLEVYTELKYLPFILQFPLKYLTMYTVHRAMKLISVFVLFWRMDSDVVVFTFLSASLH